MNIDKSFNNTDGYTSAAILNSNETITVGIYGVMNKTTDGGMNWTQSTSFFFDFPPETNNAWYVKDTSGAGMIGMTYHYDFKHIVDFNTLSSDFSTHGWEMKIDVVDSLGYLLFKGAGTPQLTQLKRTTDYGQTFSAQIDTLNNGINNLDFVSQSLGFLCGNNGEIYKTTNGGSTVGVNESDVKKKINIYPNPSANNLSIENLGQQQTVTIEIRNVTGQVVYTQKEANFSKITVNTNNIPVGVYFVNIKAGQQNLATQKWVKVE